MRRFVGCPVRFSFLQCRNQHECKLQEPDCNAGPCEPGVPSADEETPPKAGDGANGPKSENHFGVFAVGEEIAGRCEDEGHGHQDYGRHFHQIPQAEHRCSVARRREPNELAKTAIGASTAAAKLGRTLFGFIEYLGGPLLGQTSGTDKDTVCDATQVRLRPAGMKPTVSTYLLEG